MVILVLFVFTVFSVQWSIRREYSKICDSCTIGSIRWSPANPLGLTFNDVHYYFGDPQVTAVDATAGYIQIRLSITSLFKRHVLIRNITFDQLQVRIIEGDLKGPATPDKPEVEDPWIYTVQSIQVSNSSFTYSRIFPKHAADLNVYDIQAKVSTISTAVEFQQTSTHAVAQGRLEKTGDFELVLDIPIFEKMLNLGVQLEIHKLNLADLGTFFKRMSNIELKGSLLLGKSNIQIRGQELTGWSHVRYEKLGIKVMKATDRSAFEAFMANLIQKFVVHSSDLELVKDQQYRSIRLRRLKGEPIIPFILRGMKDPAMKVVARN